MSTIWFVSDTHFGHRRVIDFCKRPFSCAEEMDEELVARWNAVVHPRDTVWHLGDFALGGSPEKYKERLFGHVHLVLGNHDNENKIRKLNFESVQEVKYLRHEGQRFFLSHYAHRVWRNSIYGSYHLYGHCHGDLPGIGRSMDVGVDAVVNEAGVKEYRPLALEEVIARLEAQPATEHHVPRRLDDR